MDLYSENEPKPLFHEFIYWRLIMRISKIRMWLTKSFSIRDIFHIDLRFFIWWTFQILQIITIFLESPCIRSLDLTSRRNAVMNFVTLSCFHLNHIREPSMFVRHNLLCINSLLSTLRLSSMQLFDWGLLGCNDSTWGAAFRSWHALLLDLWRCRKD